MFKFYNSFKMKNSFKIIGLNHKKDTLHIKINCLLSMAFNGYKILVNCVIILNRLVQKCLKFNYRNPPDCLAWKTTYTQVYNICMAWFIFTGLSVT